MQLNGSLPLAGGAQSVGVSKGERKEDAGVSPLFSQLFKTSLEGQGNKQVSETLLHSSAIQHMSPEMLEMMTLLKSIMAELDLTVEEMDQWFASLSETSMQGVTMQSLTAAVEELVNDPGEDESHSQLQALYTLLLKADIPLPSIKQEVASNDKKPLDARLIQLIHQSVTASKVKPMVTVQASEARSTAEKSMEKVSQDVAQLAKIISFKDKSPEQWKELKTILYRMEATRSGIEQQWASMGAMKKAQLLDGNDSPPVQIAKDKGINIHPQALTTPLGGGTQNVDIASTSSGKSTQVIFNQLDHGMKQFMLGRSEVVPGRLTIQLQPEHLGQVTVRLQQSPQGIIALVTAHAAQTKELLEQNVHQLRHALSQQHVQIDRIEFTTVEESDQHLQKGSDEQSQQQSKEQQHEEDTPHEEQRFLEELQQELLNLQI
ncbi:flagellar hook-length control protein FliK [Litoribacterium kuwaitense]|uniref:flagellar hook-length control protein FliK n=1 Tax=Litoribacterium kuwaitense TaxID=1398745 RepID=UPI001FE8A873|nr:flagellar hook-length control protein FliK [Litoribacterium kuwaitense]